MDSRLNRIRKGWFKIRIFISLTIITSVILISYFLFGNNPELIPLLGKSVGIQESVSLRYGYYLIALLVLAASLVRMWAGSILTSNTVMSFEIRNESFMTAGPYRYVRNPIYFADLIAFTSLSLCLRPVGLLIPVLIYIHYYQLIKYEEASLKSRYGDAFSRYASETPAMLPDPGSWKGFFRDKGVFLITWDGFRHNAPYLLFIPGLIIASFTGKFLHALIIGVPGVIDWAVIHTIIGINPKRTKRKLSPE